MQSEQLIPQKTTWQLDWQEMGLRRAGSTVLFACTHHCSQH